MAGRTLTEAFDSLREIAGKYYDAMLEDGITPDDYVRCLRDRCKRVECDNDRCLLDEHNDRQRLAKEV